MLVLTRRAGEAIYIGEDVEVRVLGQVGNQVRIGITAPREIKVVRAELLINPKKKAVDDE